MIAFCQFIVISVSHREVKEIKQIIFLLLSYVGLAFTIIVFYVERNNCASIFNILSSLGSFFGGIGAIVASYLAYQGLNTWKKQLKYGKHISVIWECMLALSEIQSELFSWLILKGLESKNIEPSNNGESSDDVKEKNASSIFETLTAKKLAFTTLDTIVIRNECEWRNKFDALENQVRKIDGIYEESNDSQKSLITEEFKILTGYVNELINELKKLEEDIS